MIIIPASSLPQYLDGQSPDEDALAAQVDGIIRAVREDGVDALRRFSRQFDGVLPPAFEVDLETAAAETCLLKQKEPALCDALEFAASHIRAFAEYQKAGLASFEKEIAPGVFAGQNVLPLSRAVVYVPRGRYPLLSTVLMGVIPARVAGVAEVCVTSPPCPDGLPDRRVLAAASLAGADRIFALGGAQAIAAFAYGVFDEERELIPRADIIAGPGNKYVAWAKRRLSGVVGIEAVAGPTDVLVIADEHADAEIVAADLIAQAEHDEDARARALVPSAQFAETVEAALRQQLDGLSTRKTAEASLKNGLLVIYTTREEAILAANRIAPEHLELQVDDRAAWLPHLNNYGSLFISNRAAEALGDYSAGINHTLPTMGCSRFSGGLSVRHFLKIVTSLRVEGGGGGGGVSAAATKPAIEPFINAARELAYAEGLTGHARSLEIRQQKGIYGDTDRPAQDN